MNDREKFNETSLPKKDDFCNQWNMEAITDTDCPYTKRVCKDF